jgi:hypothetical protein
MESRTYNLDSDDSEEEDLDQELDDENNDNGNDASNKGSFLTWKPAEIEKLKQQTNDLVDTKWKETRIKHLLQKMLELDQPLITHKMVDFLLQDGVTQQLMGFITQLTPSEEPKQPRPSPTDTQSNSMKYAYRAVILLSPENPSDALNAFLSKRATLITTSIFDIFSSSSMGSFYHAYRIIECLLRCYPTEVYSGLLSDGRIQERLSSMVSYMGFPPVCELLVMLVAFTPVPRATQLYISSAQSRHRFFQALLRHDFLFQVARTVVDPKSVCCVDSYVDAGQHSTVASQFLQEIVDKLSMEDTGDELLRVIAETTAEVEGRRATYRAEEVTSAPETTEEEGVSPLSSSGAASSSGALPPLSFVDLLINSVISTSSTDEEDCSRRSSARIICFLLRKAAEPEVVSFISQGGGVPAPVYIPNRLYTCREQIVNIVRSRLGDITSCLLKFDQSQSAASSSSSVSSSSSRSSVSSNKYSSYEVVTPFSTVRSLVIELVVLMAESDETVAGLLPVELWRLLMGWVIVYAHNNIYHALMYRLVFAVLRQGQELPQRTLFQKVKFASFLVDNFIPYEVDPEGNSSGGVYTSTPKRLDKKTPEYRVLVNRIASRGFIMNCANAIRLQASCQVASSFLPSLIKSHERWREFLPMLSIATDIQLKFGMGIKVSSIDNMKGGGGERGGMSMLHVSEPLTEDNHDSRYAKTLGFYDEEAYSLDGHDGQTGHGEEEEDSEEMDASPWSVTETCPPVPPVTLSTGGEGQADAPSGQESSSENGGGDDGNGATNGHSEIAVDVAGEEGVAIDATEQQEEGEVDQSDAQSTVSELSAVSQE